MKYWPLFMLISMLVLTAFLKSTMAQGGLSDAQVEDVLYRCLKQKLPGVERDFADHGRAFDPTSGRNFFYDKEKHAWKDGKTGESICYGSISKAMVEDALYRCLKQKLPGVERDFADHGRAFDPTTGRNFFYDKDKQAWIDSKTGECICPKCEPDKPVTTPHPTPTPQPSPTPKAEVRVGYLFQHAFDETVKNLNGFHTGVYYNIGHVQIGGEFTGSFGSTITTTPIVLDTSLSRFTYLFGPQFKLYENDKARVFVHSLFGGVHDKTTVKIGTGTPGSFSANAFAMEFGGGFDIRVNKHFFVTPVTVDYLRTHFGGQWQNNVLITSGIGFEFGKK